jgi:hypothetical protein
MDQAAGAGGFRIDDDLDAAFFAALMACACSC